jgi:hypothetical protein
MATNSSFTRFASVCAYLTAVAGVAYSIVFVVTRDDDTRFGEGLEGSVLLAGGVLAVVVTSALYERVRAQDPGFALLALLLGAAGGFGAAIHGAYQLALAAAGTLEESVTPNPVDPRGFLTLAVTAAAVTLFAGLIGGRIRQVGFVFAVLLVILWVGRLGGADSDDAVLFGPAALAGLGANPLWYVLVGRELGTRAP